MRDRKSNLLRVESNNTYIIVARFVLLLILPVFVWLFTRDVQMTAIAFGAIILISVVSFFIGRDVYKFYDDSFVVNEAKTEHRNYEISLQRVGGVTTKHFFFQPKNTGNIIVMLQDVKRLSLTERLLGAREEEISYDYPFLAVFMRNITDYQEKAKVIEDIVKKAQEVAEANDTAVLQGVTNVDEMLPWLENAKER